MTQNERELLSEKIKLEIKHLTNEISLLEKKMQPIKYDCSLGALAQNSALGEQEIDAKVLIQSESRLEKLKHVLKHISSEDYGICTVCDEEINIERLKILPESIVCIDCANEI